MAADCCRYALDDRMPVDQDRDMMNVQISRGGEIWPCLLEKAFAAMLGGYAALDGGCTSTALKALTGCPSDRIIKIDREADGWEYVHLLGGHSSALARSHGPTTTTAAPFSPCHSARLTHRRRRLLLRCWAPEFLMGEDGPDSSNLREGVWPDDGSTGSTAREPAAVLQVRTNGSARPPDT